MTRPYHDAGGFLVTDRIARTPKKSFAIERIEAVSLRRSLFLMTLVPALGSIALCALAWRYLYASEIAFILIAAGAALAGSWQVGTLKVETLALKDDEGGTVHGLYARLVPVRAAIEQALADRGQRS